MIEHSAAGFLSSAHIGVENKGRGMPHGPVGSFPREMELGGRRGCRKEDRKKGDEIRQQWSSHIFLKSCPVLIRIDSSCEAGL